MTTGRLSSFEKSPDQERIIAVYLYIYIAVYCNCSECAVHRTVSMLIFRNKMVGEETRSLAQLRAVVSR